MRSLRLIARVLRGLRLRNLKHVGGALSRAARALGPLRSESFSAAGADRSRPGDAVGAIVKSAGKKKKENTFANLEPKRKYTKGANEGRKTPWTEEEHGRFVEGLSLFQRDWQAVATHVGTRTKIQVNGHAQKHFNRIIKEQTDEYIPPKTMMSHGSAVERSVAKDTEFLITYEEDFTEEAEGEALGSEEEEGSEEKEEEPDSANGAAPRSATFAL